MKVKFLTKAEREQLKKDKEKQATEAESEIKELSLPHANLQIEEEKPVKNANNRESSSESKESYERSREKRTLNNSLTTEEKDERQKFKRKYLGLERPELNNRFKHNYKDKLLFEWEKSDDTSGGILNNFSKDSLKAIEKSHSKDDETLGKNWKDKKAEEMTERDWKIFREDNEIFIKGGRVTPPFREWNENHNLSPELLKNLKRLKFDKPTSIQMQAIPIGFENKDMVAIAPTGEGKTLGFLIPVLHHVSNLERITAVNYDEGPHALILVPSRELAEQIEDELEKIKYGNIRALRVVGGTQLDLQWTAVQRGNDIIVGTPGRLKELLNKGYLSLERCSWVVIDEADKMISENLIEDIEEIFTMLGSKSTFTRDEHGKDRVTHMFSATMVPEIEKLTKKYLVAPVFVTIGEEGAGKKDIEQAVYFINEQQKNEELRKILRNLSAPIIVFVNERTTCDKLVKLINERFGRSCQDYHGGKSQENRQSIIQNFRNGKFEVLVATDLGGRGLDIKGITAAISYDAPKNISEFIHRAGRSGRAGVKGKAFTLLTNADELIFYDVKTFLERNGFKIPDQLRDHPASQMRPGTYAQISRRKQVVYTN